MRPTTQATVLALLAALSWLPGCASVGGGQEVLPPDVFLADVSPVGGGLFEQRILLTFRVTNPNAFDLDVSGMAFQLDMNGEPLARGVSNEPMLLAGLGEQLVTAEASTTTFGLLHQLLRLGERRELAYELSGRMHLSGAGVSSVAFQRSAQLGPSLAPEPSAP